MKKGQKMSEEQKRKISKTLSTRSKRPKPKGYRKPKPKQRIREKQPLPGEESVVRMPNGRFITTAGPDIFIEPKLKVSEVRELAQKHTRTAIDRLAQLMFDKDVRVARAACVDLLDRAHGKVGLMKEDESEATVATREAMTEMLLDLTNRRNGNKTIEMIPEDAEIVEDTLDE
jgi:hypothetical protein